MTTRIRTLAAWAALLPGMAAAADLPGAGVNTVPATRGEMREFLEGSKHHQPRLPLPAPTAEELAEAEKRPANGPFRGIINNGRMRKMYLPAGVLSGGFTREPDPAMTLGYPFQTRLFWIVSRLNNCAYCMGHQEAKLAAAGMTDDQIAALDGDWANATEAERAAYAFTRKITLRPDTIGDADIAALKGHHTDAQIVEILNAVAGFNAMNRWTGALRIPQEEHRVYKLAEAKPYDAAKSVVAPYDPATKCAAPSRRPALESRAEVEKALAAARERTPRVALADESKARELLPMGAFPGDAPLPQWVRLLTVFPKAGPGRVSMHRASETEGTLDPLTKARIAWIAARNDRAWYALGHAQKRLRALGQSDDAIYALDGPSDGFSPADQAVIRLARKLTNDPALIADEDIAALRKSFTDKQTAEIVFHVTEAAFFDRLTEPAGLRLEP